MSLQPCTKVVSIPDIHLALAYTWKGFLWGRRVVDIRWDGNDFGLGLKDFLNSDESLKAQIMEASAYELGIESNIKAKSWIITTGLTYGSPWRPSCALWECYQAIALRLLGRDDVTTLRHSVATRRQWEWEEIVD